MATKPIISFILVLGFITVISNCDIPSEPEIPGFSVTVLRQPVDGTSLEDLRAEFQWEYFNDFQDKVRIQVHQVIESRYSGDTRIVHSDTLVAHPDSAAAFTVEARTGKFDVYDIGGYYFVELRYLHCIQRTRKALLISDAETDK